jgi:hypothetical protein
MRSIFIPISITIFVHILLLCPGPKINEMAKAKRTTTAAPAKEAAKTAKAAKASGKYMAFAIGERVRVPYRAIGKTETEAIENMLGKAPAGGYSYSHGFTVVHPDGKRIRHDF